MSSTAVTTTTTATTIIPTGTLTSLPTATPSPRSSSAQILAALSALFGWLLRYPGLFAVSVVSNIAVLSVAIIASRKLLGREDPEYKIFTPWCIGGVAAHFALLLGFASYNESLPAGEGSWPMAVVETELTILLICVMVVVSLGVVWAVRYARGGGEDAQGMRRASAV